MKRTIIISTLLVLGGCRSPYYDYNDDGGAEAGEGTESDVGTSSDTTGDGDGDGDGDEETGDTGDTGPMPDMGDGGVMSFCGDGIAEGDEECDGEDMNGETCETQGFDSGTTSCNLDCTVNTDMCGLGFCPAQPVDGPLSACDVPQQGLGYCEGGESCVGEPGMEGVCAATMCESHGDCAVQGYAGCQAVPRCYMQACVYECTGIDSDCPNPMSCVFSEVLNTYFCL